MITGSRHFFLPKFTVMGVVISSSFLRSSTSLPLIVSHLRIFYLEAYILEYWLAG